MSNKRKRLSIVLASFMMLVEFSSCSINNSNSSISVNPVPEVHVHRFDQRVIDDKYKALDSTCEYPATYYSCKCGKKGTEVFEYGDPLGHDFSDWTYEYRSSPEGCDTRYRTCKRCGKKEVQNVYFYNNLIFEINDEKLKQARVVVYREFFKGDLDTHVIIPEIYNGYTITEIDDEAFMNNQMITCVDIPKTIGKIGSKAFKDCKNLQIVGIPGDSRLKDIMSYLFMNCLSILSESVFPLMMRTVVFFSFAYSSFKEIKLNEWLESFYSNAFFNCPISGELKISSSTKLLCQCSFSFTDITSLYIPGNVSLKQYSIFTDNRRLKKNVIGEGIEEMGIKIFMDCTALEDVSLPDALKSISTGCFINFSSLKRIKIEEAVTEFDLNCFQGSGLESIDIPENVTVIERGCFNNCKNQRKITIKKYNLYYVEDNSLIRRKGNRLCFCCNNDLGREYISKNVKFIPEGSISCSTKELYIPKSLNEFDGFVFYNPCELTDVFYEGSEEEYKKIKNGGFNYYFDYATIHYNSYKTM